MLIIGKKLSPYILLSISGLLAASDQAVKWLVQQSMAYGESVSVTPFFNWVHLWNTGAAFSILANAGGWQRYFFIGITVLISIFLIKLIRENRHKEKPLLTVLSLAGPWVT
jgi:signal peptidase II